MTKRTFSILLLALCFCLAASCGPAGQSGPAEDVSASDATADTPLPAPAEEDASASDTRTPSRPEGTAENNTDFSALSADECVEDALPEPGALPRVTLDCPGAESINQDIQNTFSSVAEDPTWRLHYQCAKGAGHVLSIVIVRQADEWMEHTAYNLDLSTGQVLSAGELLSQLGVDPDELANLELAVLGEEFTHQFGVRENQADPAFYDQQYERTTSPDNKELEKLWFGGDGQLCFAGRIYPLAGAEYYEYDLSTGWVF